MIIILIREIFVTIECFKELFSRHVMIQPNSQFNFAMIGLGKKNKKRKFPIFSKLNITFVKFTEIYF